MTLELAILLLEKLALEEDKSLLSDAHFAAVVGAKEDSASLLTNYYKVRFQSHNVLDIPRYT